MHIKERRGFKGRSALPASSPANWVTWGQNQRTACEELGGRGRNLTVASVTLWTLVQPAVLLPTHHSPVQGASLWSPRLPQALWIGLGASVTLTRKKMDHIFVITHFKLKYSISFHYECRQQTRGRMARPAPRPCHQYKSQILASHLAGVTENLTFLSHRTPWLLGLVISRIDRFKN